MGEDNCFFDIFFDEVIFKILIFIYLSLGIEEIMGDKKVFINFYCDILMNYFFILLDFSKVVIEVVEMVDVDDVFVCVCKYIKEMGYFIVLDDYDMKGKWEVFIFFISVIKIDIIEIFYDEILVLVEWFKVYNIKLVVERIEIYEEF